MLYLSQLLGAPVEDMQGERVGKIIDILVPASQVGASGPVYPSALLVEGEEEEPWRVPIADVEWHDGSLRLRVPTGQLMHQPPASDQQEVSLAHDVLDKQVIDIARKKAVRVNDVALGDNWQLLGIDSSTLGLVRRLAPAWLLGTRNKARPSPLGLIPWDHIELIGLQAPEEEQEEEGAQPSQPLAPPAQRPQSGHLAELRPADIAAIVHELTPGQGTQLIERLDDETAADVMEEIDTDRQRHILEHIQAARAADILDAMGPDEAADLLSQLPEERAQELLRLMQPEESEEVQELLEYEEDTAGGLMTTDYLALDRAKSVADALDAVRQTVQEQDIRPIYIYCVPDENADECPLLGLVSLWDLLTAAPTQTLEHLMETDFISVQPDTPARSVAELMAKYNLLSLPVVNEQGILEGIVTVDDALDVLLPPERRRKPRRMY
jgi:CBS domain-containing protein